MLNLDGNSSEFSITEGKPITPEYLQNLLDSSEVIDLNKVENRETLASPIKSYNASMESDLDAH